MCMYLKTYIDRTHVFYSWHACIDVKQIKPELGFARFLRRLRWTRSESCRRNPICRHNYPTAADLCAVIKLMLACNTRGFPDKFWIPISLPSPTILTRDLLDPNVFSDNPAGCRVCRRSLSVNNWLSISAVEILKFLNVWKPRSGSSLNQPEQRRVMPPEIFGIFVR